MYIVAGISRNSVFLRNPINAYLQQGVPPPTFKLTESLSYEKKKNSFLSFAMKSFERKNWKLKCMKIYAWRLRVCRYLESFEYPPSPEKCALLCRKMDGYTVFHEPYEFASSRATMNFCFTPLVAKKMSRPKVDTPEYNIV